MSLAIGGCGNSFPACDNNDECVGYNRGANFCIDGTCRECSADSDCDLGEECRNNGCSRIAGWCDGDNPCPAGQVCRNNRCQAGCDDASPCPAGLTCEDGRCVDWECRLDSDCGEHEACENHICRDQRACADREFEVVFFDFDESSIRSDQENRLEHNATCLNDFPRDEVRIEGHCDERGTDAYNLALGERRARATKRSLGRMGIDNDRIGTISYGESRPDARCHNETCWRQNRRTAFGWR